MGGHLGPVSSNSRSGFPLENLTVEAERWIAALYSCVRTSYGDDAARTAADCWFRIFEERFEGSSDLPRLKRITVEAIAVFASRLVLTGQSTR